MIAAIIQARTGSTRLPGKIFKGVLGRPILWHFINRVERSELIDKIVIATTTKKRDDIVVEFAEEKNIDFYRGDENDVLDRFYHAARLYKIDVIVRVTPDCPLIDPSVVDKVIEEFLKGKYDLVSNFIKPTFPDGLDVEVFSFGTLEKAWKETRLLSERVHVTPYIKKNPHIFKIVNFENDCNLSMHRWTLDEETDLEFIKEVYKRLYVEGEIFHMNDVLKLLEENPELKEINKGIIRDEGYLKSIKKDKVFK